MVPISESDLQNAIKTNGFDIFTRDQLIHLVKHLEKDKIFFKRENKKSKEENLQLSKKVKILKNDKKEFKRSERKLKMLVSMIAEQHLDVKSEFVEKNQIHVSKIQTLTEKVKKLEEQNALLVPNKQERIHKNFLIEKILELQSILRAKNLSELTIQEIPIKNATYHQATL